MSVKGISFLFADRKGNYKKTLFFVGEKCWDSNSEDYVIFDIIIKSTRSIMSKLPSGF